DPSVDLRIGAEALGLIISPRWPVVQLASDFLPIVRPELVLELDGGEELQEQHIKAPVRPTASRSNRYTEAILRDYT
ncbi:hypothetical protein MMC24_006198, partial [Lignoscripta atroalba]|nr:hypothetical protein [Lignoscripta atroalba]